MKRPYIRIISILLIMNILSLFLCSCTKKTDQQRFNALIDQVFTETASKDSLSLHYLLTHPENYNIHEKKVTLGTYSVKQMEKDCMINENYLAALNKIKSTNLDPESQTMYEILNDTLKKNLTLGAYPYLSEQLGPSTGLQAQLPILLAEYRLTTIDDVKGYLNLLRCINDYFNQICSFEIEKSKRGYFMSDEVADAIITQCKDFITDPSNNFLITYFNEKINAMSNLKEEEKDEFKKQNQEIILTCVIPAYQTMIDTLSSLKGSGKNKLGLAGFEHGKEYYETMVQSMTGSSKTIPEMKNLLKRTLNESFATLTSLSVKDPTLYQQYQDLSYPYTDPNEIMEYLITAMSKDFPSIDSVNYHIKYVDKSLQEHLSPAMYIVSPIDDCSENNIYINQLPSYDMSKIFPTIAHEGYPGHLYQNVYFLNQKKHPLRSVINYTGYEEGWATYVECYSYRLAKLKPNLTLFLQSNMVAVHCLYSLTDIGIHYDGWTKEDTIKYWRNYVVSEKDAESIYYSILAEPGIYLPYSIGYLELMQLRTLAKEILGPDYTPMKFHQYVLDFGPAPFDLLKKNLSSLSE